MIEHKGLPEGKAIFGSQQEEDFYWETFNRLVRMKVLKMKIRKNLKPRPPKEK